MYRRRRLSLDIRSGPEKGAEKGAEKGPEKGPEKGTFYIVQFSRLVYPSRVTAVG